MCISTLSYWYLRFTDVFYADRFFPEQDLQSEDKRLSQTILSVEWCHWIRAWICADSENVWKRWSFQIMCTLSFTHSIVVSWFESQRAFWRSYQKSCVRHNLCTRLICRWSHTTINLQNKMESVIFKYRQIKLLWKVYLYGIFRLLLVFSLNRESSWALCRRLI